MKLKNYQRPTMMVVKLQHQCQILGASDQPVERGVGVQNYEMDATEED